MMQVVVRRVENLTRVSRSHYENLQVLHYTESQFYMAHNDYEPTMHLTYVPAGPRIMTLFIYLSDVEVGGGTRFTDLNYTVSPRRGRAVLFPDVQDSDTFAKEEKTRHEAVPVGAGGVKYAVNVWMHQFPYRKMYKDHWGRP